MDPKLMALLITAASLSASVSEDQAIVALKAMPEDKRAALAKAYGDGGETLIAGLTADKSPKTEKKPNDSVDPDAELVALEAKRVENIQLLGSTFKKISPAELGASIDAAVLESVSKNLTVAQARQSIQGALAGNAPIPNAAHSIDVGTDRAIASLADAIPQALFLRANSDVTVEQLAKFEAREATERRMPHKAYLGKVHERVQSLRHMKLTDMYRSYLAALGAPDDRLRNMDAVALANCMGFAGMRDCFGGKIASRMAMLAESTSDFANITLDAINKSLRFYYLDAPRTWDKWLQRKTAPDFKNIHRVALSEAPSMTASDEGGPLNYVTLGDSKETYALKEYKGGIKLTRRAIINDDMDAFSAAPRLQSNTAVRLEEDTAYGLLNNGTSTSAPYAMSDTYAVFDATNHANNTTSGTAISVSSLQTGWDAIFNQKGPKGAAYLELQPKFLIVPSSIYWTARQLIDSTELRPSQSSNAAAVSTVGTSNPFNKVLTIIPSVRLRATSSTAWYLAADYRDGQINTGELCFLESEPEPVLRMETDFDTEDVKYAVRHTLAGKIIDYRGFYRNAGA